jgi:hypothetical protein
LDVARHVRALDAPPYETFELPEVPDRLLPDRLAITFLTDRDGNIVSLSTPLEPMVKDYRFCTPCGRRLHRPRVPRAMRRPLQERRDNASCHAG